MFLLRSAIQPFKYLSEKPVFKFDDAQFLQIRAAEVAGLVEVSVRVEQEDRLVQDIIKHITNDYSNEFAEKWNAERKLVGERASREILFPQMSKWLKEKLASDAADWLAEQCRINLEYVCIFFTSSPTIFVWSIIIT